MAWVPGVPGVGQCPLPPVPQLTWKETRSAARFSGVLVSHLTLSLLSSHRVEGKRLDLRVQGTAVQDMLLPPCAGLTFHFVLMPRGEQHPRSEQPPQGPPRLSGLCGSKALLRLGTCTCARGHLPAAGSRQLAQEPSRTCAARAGQGPPVLLQHWLPAATLFSTSRCSTPEQAWEPACHSGALRRVVRVALQRPDPLVQGLTPECTAFRGTFRPGQGSRPMLYTSSLLN